jgi:hypothetical protein
MGMYDKQDAAQGKAPEHVEQVNPFLDGNG